jgi:hypothetical protein
MAEIGPLGRRMNEDMTDFSHQCVFCNETV